MYKIYFLDQNPADVSGLLAEGLEPEDITLYAYDENREYLMTLIEPTVVTDEDGVEVEYFECPYEKFLSLKEHREIRFIDSLV